MIERSKLYNGISKAAWGYFFIYFNFNLNSVSILPAFVGYLLFLSSIRDLQEEERELSLLRVLAILLALWHGMEWIVSLMAVSFDGKWPFVDIIICLVDLYFHFQLLTNMASIAAKYQPEGYAQDDKLLRYRTLQTIMLTSFMVLTYLSPWLTEAITFIPVLMLIVYLIAGICLMKALFDLRKIIR